MDSPSDFTHITETTRPWGNFRVLTKNIPSTVKIITVSAGEELSLQYHNHRAEFWRIISGTPLVTIGKTIVKAKAGDEFIIPIGTEHRMAAPESEISFLEIAAGEFDESGDIVRIEDKYGRA